LSIGSIQHVLAEALQITFSIKKGKKKKVIGGGAEWYYTDTSGTILLKAVQEISLESEYLDTYYFYQDSLIYLKTSISTYTNNNKRSNWEGHYYFQNHTLFFKQDNNKLIFHPEPYIKTARKFFEVGKIWRRQL
jgi:hypothetical protein